MKKVFVAAATLAVAYAGASCSQGSSTPKTNLDSVSVILGEEQGQQMARALDQLASQSEDSVDREEFIKGFEEGLKDHKQFVRFAGALTGAQIAKQYKDDGLNADLLLKAFKSALKGDSTGLKIADSLAGPIMNAFQEKKYEEMRKKQEEAAEKAAVEQKKAGEEFAKKFKAENPNAKTTESGLIYIIEQEGTGVNPTAQDQVKVNYKGTLVDGTTFDEGEGIEFPLSSVIKGWTEALQLIKTGGKIKVVIPSDLAYGNQNMGQIKPGSTLIFEVELLEVKKGAEDAHNH